MRQKIHWCMKKNPECGDFARWLTVMIVAGEEYEVVTCTDHREDVVGRMIEAAHELGIDLAIRDLSAEILQYDMWVSG